MSKKKTPSYYMMGNKYVACNKAARKMFKKKGITYLDSKLVLKMNSLLELSKKKGKIDEEDDKSKD